VGQKYKSESAEKTDRNDEACAGTGRMLSRRRGQAR
jgi:hypothetical protein